MVINNVSVLEVKVDVFVVTCWSSTVKNFKNQKLYLIVQRANVKHLDLFLEDLKRLDLVIYQGEKVLI